MRKHWQQEGCAVAFVCSILWCLLLATLKNAPITDAQILPMPNTTLQWKNQPVAGYLPEVHPGQAGVVNFYHQPMAAYGWVRLYEQGRQYMVTYFERAIASGILYIDGNDVAMVEFAIQTVYKLGFRLIIGSGVVYITPFKKHCNSTLSYGPEQLFFVVGNQQPTPLCTNIATFFPMVYEQYYMGGMIIGSQLREGQKVCKMNIPIPIAYYMANAFTLGLQAGFRKFANETSGSPVLHYWALATNPASLSEVNHGIRELVDKEKCTYIIQGYDNTATMCLYPMTNGLKVVCAAFDVGDLLGELVMTSIVPRMGPLFINWVNAYIQRKWIPNEMKYVYMSEGGVDLMHPMSQNKVLSPIVPFAQTQMVLAQRQLFINDTIRNNPWCPPAFNWSGGAGCMPPTQAVLQRSFIPGIIVHPTIAMPVITEDEEGAPSTPVQLLHYIMIPIALILILIIMGFFLKYPDNQAVKSTSGRLSLIGMVGQMMVISNGIFTGILMPSDTVCLTRWWLGAIGFTMYSSTLFVTNYRIKAIFHQNKKFRQVNYPDWKLVIAICASLVPPILYFSIMTALNPSGISTLDTHVIETKNGVYLTNEGEQWITHRHFIKTCSRRTINIAVVFAYIGVIWLGNIWVSIKTVKVQAEFNESSKVAACAFGTLTVALMTIGPELMTDMTTDAAAMLRFVYTVLAQIFFVGWKNGYAAKWIYLVQFKKMTAEDAKSKDSTESVMGMKPKSKIRHRSSTSDNGSKSDGEEIVNRRSISKQFGLQKRIGSQTIERRGSTFLTTSPVSPSNGGQQRSVTVHEEPEEKVIPNVEPNSPSGATQQTPMLPDSQAAATEMVHVVFEVQQTMFP